MKLEDLVKALKIYVLHGNAEVEVAGVQSDSRKVAEGDMFVAVRGTVSDGHAYIEKAVNQGASVVVCEEIPDGMESKCNFVVVPDSAEALGLLISQWYDNPSRKLKLVGVTGTNGKTTIATVLYNMFRVMGHKVGLISTVCNYIDDNTD